MHKYLLPLAVALVAFIGTTALAKETNAIMDEMKRLLDEKM